MGRGASKAGGLSGGGTITTQAKENIKGLTGYSITTSSGDEIEFYFRKSGDDTFYSNTINGNFEQTPNNWTEKEMIQAVENNGGSANKYSNKQLLNIEKNRLEEKRKTDEFLNKEYARNKGADITHKAYRNTKKAKRISKRR